MPSLHRNYPTVTYPISGRLSRARAFARWADALAVEAVALWRLQARWSREFEPVRAKLWVDRVAPLVPRWPVEATSFEDL